jgi:hypothetical protein
MNTTTTTELILVEAETPTLTASASARKAELLAYAGTIGHVRNAADAHFAGDCLRSLAIFCREIEASRSTAKAPFLAIGKAIDALGRALAGEVEAEQRRISASLGAWQEEQRRIEQEAQQKAWAEEQRLRREAEEREAWEEASKSFSAAAPDEAAQEQAAASRHEQLARDIATVRESAAAAAPGKVAGIAVRSEIEFEITDLQALYEAAPYLVTLTPNKAAIKGALKSLREDQSLPGLKWWRKAAVSIRV